MVAQTGLAVRPDVGPVATAEAAEGVGVPVSAVLRVPPRRHHDPALPVQLDPPVHVTAAAATRVADLLTSEAHGARLRFAVHPGGCSGFSYEMHFDTEDQVGDVEWVVPAGSSSFAAVVDAASASLLDGAQLDFADGLEGGFRVSNPPAQRTCGCGRSFS